MPMKTIPVIMYTKDNCPLCVEGRAVLDELSREIPLDIEEFDIYTDDDLLKAYQLEVPVVEAAGQKLDYGRLSKKKIKQKLLEMTEQHCIPNEVISQYEKGE